MQECLKCIFKPIHHGASGAQRDCKDPVDKELVVKKLKQAQERRYITEGYVVSLLAFFTVEKGNDDIRMVSHRSISGKNDAMLFP
jgi:uncharacterized DUF497 family protein